MSNVGRSSPQESNGYLADEIFSLFLSYQKTGEVGDFFLHVLDALNRIDRCRRVLRFCDNGEINDVAISVCEYVRRGRYDCPAQFFTMLGRICVWRSRDHARHRRLSGQVVSVGASDSVELFAGPVQDDSMSDSLLWSDVEAIMMRNDMAGIFSRIRSGKKLTKTMVLENRLCKQQSASAFVGRAKSILKQYLLQET